MASSKIDDLCANGAYGNLKAAHDTVYNSSFEHKNISNFGGHEALHDFHIEEMSTCLLDENDGKVNGQPVLVQHGIICNMPVGVL